MAGITDANEFIESIKIRNSKYSDPCQAMYLYNSLLELSKGIYTEEERFIYELLQNADDAAKCSKLKVRIDIDKQHFIFSHDGESFDEIDVESICSVGDGGKSNDENKTGYKGIGFKSVFSHSNSVAIKTGNYFFKFSEEDWTDHWQSNWGNKSEWQKGRTEKKKNPGIKMPWQIIPIPLGTDILKFDQNIIKEFNVSTILFDIKSDKLAQRVLDLLKDSKILLFLRSKEVTLDVYINGSLNLSIVKQLRGDKSIGLYNNKDLKSEWIVSTKEISLPEEVVEDISRDDKTPSKLKNANTCEVSYAIQKEDKSLVKAKEALVYTYLPTSVSCGLPFVVNSNFITDAGRQQLQKESKWNLWIFNQMAYYYFEWIAELAKEGKLDKSFLAIIPDELHFGELGSKFNDGLEKAIDEIAFIPNKNGKLLKVKDAVYDKTRLTELVSSDVLLKYLNNKYNTSYDSNSLIPEYNNYTKIKNLGVRIFGLDELDDFFRSEVFQSNHSLNDNFKLINFLYEYTTNLKNTDDKYEWEEKLKKISFIFDENEVLRTPSEIYFPSVQTSNEFKDDIYYINEIILKNINKDASIKQWLIGFGVAEPTDINFITKTIIGNKEFITEKNAIEVGRYLFNAYKKGKIKDDVCYNLKGINIQTQNGALKKSYNCFLSDFYDPELRLEKVFINDFYISELYYQETDFKSEWKTFFLKIGVKDDFEWQLQTIDFYDKKDWENRYDSELLEIIWTTCKKFAWMSWEGWNTDRGGFCFTPSEIVLHEFSFIEHAVNYVFSKLFFSKMFSKYSPSSVNCKSNIYVRGWTGMARRTLYDTELKPQECPTNHFLWILENVAIFPSTDGSVRNAKDLLLNSPENKSISGNYLNIVDVDSDISDEWLEIVPFQRYLKIEDYLNILTQISLDLEKVSENKARILNIYKILSHNYLSRKNELSEWGKNNKLLSVNNEFINAEDLKFVSERGFESEDLIFSDTNDNSPELVRLFELFGVTVIHEFKPEIINPRPNPSLKIRLQETLPYILLLAEKNNGINFSESYVNLSERIDTFKFLETDDIVLSYENKGKLVRGNSVKSYLSGDALYYKGIWNSPLTLYSLISDISILLDIKDLNQELNTILLSDFDDIRALLNDLRINVTETISRKEFELSVQKTNSYIIEDDEIEPSENLLDYSDERSRISINSEVKQRIFEELKAKGFTVPNTLDINYTIVKGITNPKGKPITLVVKSGKKGRLYFNPSEWLALSRSGAQLFVVSRGNIVRNVTMDDLQECNVTFHMRFNTQAFSLDTNLKAFANFFHYLKYTHFIFNTPESTNDYLQEFGLNERNKSVIDLTADDQNLLL